MQTIDYVRAALSFVQLFVTCGTGIGLVYAFLKFTHKPTDDIKDRLKALEDRMDDMDDWKENVERRLHEGVEHFQSLDESNRVIQHALLAIMDNALDHEGGKEELKEARAMLYEHLSKRG